MRGKAPGSKKTRVLFLSLFVSALFLTIGFLSFTSLMLFNALYSGRGAGSSYFFKKSSLVLFNGGSGFHLMYPGLLGGSHFTSFYYVLAASIIISIAVLTLMFVYFHRLIIRHDGVESALRSVERNILEIPSTIMHEIKGNINSLSINSRVLCEKVKNDANENVTPAIAEDSTRRGSDINRISSIIESETRRLTETMDNILRFAKDYSLNLEKVNIKELVKSAVSRSIPKAEGRGVEIIAAPMEDDVDAVMDRDLMEQVLVNLISNAAESYDGLKGEVPSRSPRVLVYISYFIEKVVINIEDNGKGMDGDVLKKIFDPFFSMKRSGTGLGLSLVKKILNAHGFDMKIESFVDKGTRVSVVLKNFVN